MCLAILSQRSVVGLAMIQRFRSVVLLGWCRDTSHVSLECPVDMPSTIPNANDVAMDKCSQDSLHASRWSVADITTIQRLINAATGKYFPGSRGVLFRALTINFVEAISSTLRPNNVAMETPWLPFDRHAKGVVPHCSSHSAAAVAMELKLFLNLLGVLFMGEEPFYLGLFIFISLYSYVYVCYLRLFRCDK